MKGTWVLTIGCAVVGALAASASGVEAQGGTDLLDRPARLVIEATPLGEALRRLQSASGVALAYSPDVIPAERRVDCPCGERTVRGALEHLLEGTELVFVESRRQVLIGRRVLVDTSGELAGRVIEAGSGRPVPRADVQVQGGPSVSTNADGRFVVRGLDAGIRVLRVTSLGFEPREMEVPVSTTDVLLQLVRRPIPLAEIVIEPGRFGVLEASTTLSGNHVSREDIEAIPQFGDDVFRTLKRMPGVVAEDISTKLNVRGGGDRDLLVHLDGLELYEPYHLKDLDGALGIIDVQSLGGVDLVTGGFPAEYGDKTAGVFNMYSRTAPASGTRTTLGMSLSSLSAISQGGFADQRGQWLLSLRRGFLEYALAVAGVEDDLDPRYWDALGRVQYLLGDDHLLWLEVLYAGDALDWFDDGTRSAVTSTWTNGYAWAGWKATLTPRLRSDLLISAGRLTRDRVGDVDNPNGGAFTPLTADVRDEASFDFVGLRNDLQLDLDDDLLVKAGAELRSTSGEYDYASVATRYDVTDQNRLFVRTDSRAVALSPSGSEVGSYVSLRGRAGRLTWEGGLRYDWLEHTDERNLAPRLLGRVDLGERTNLRASWGRYYQSHGLHELSARDGERAFAPSERAHQVAAGLEHGFRDGLSVRLEAYRRDIDDPRPLFVNLSRNVDPILEVGSDRRRLDPSEARAAGLELIVARDGADASWSASYALAKAEDLIDGDWAPRTLDQRHTVNLRGSYRLGPSWQLSGAWSYHSGWPFTEQFLDLELGVSEDSSETVDILRRGFGPYNARRLPAYHRLDVRITRNFEFVSSRLEVYLDIFNAYNRTNLRGYHWFLRRSGNVLTTHRTTGEEQLPILPTIGFRWVF